MLCVTSVTNSFQSLPIFCHKELHLRFCIELESNIVTWSTKIPKWIWGTPPSSHDGMQPWVFPIKLSFWDLTWTKWSSYQLIDINSGFVINFYVEDINTQNLDQSPILFALIQFWLLPPLESCKLNLKHLHHHLLQKQYFVIF